MTATRLLLLSLVLLLQGCEAVLIGAAAGGTALVAADRRTTGIFVEDENIELKSQGRINERFRDQIHINVTSYNRNVLLTGEAPTEALRGEVEKTVRSVENVRDVVNEIAVAGPSSYAARSNDSYITSKVKARFLDANKFQANHVKVVTENGVVYLLGLVKRKEAADAVEVASTTGGVRKVVKVFEYLD